MPAVPALDALTGLRGLAALHTDAGRYREFLGERLARIYPAHLCAQLLTLACVAILAPFGRSLYRSAEFSVEGWWAPLLLVQAWQFPVPGVWNVPAWSISAEWAAYLLFPLLVLPVRRLREPCRVMLAIARVYRYVEEPARRGLTRRWLRREPLPS